jgi:hypothetical protein
MVGIESPENVVGLLNTHKELDFDCAPIPSANECLITWGYKPGLWNFDIIIIGKIVFCTSKGFIKGLKFRFYFIQATNQSCA